MVMNIELVEHRNFRLKKCWKNFKKSFHCKRSKNMFSKNKNRSVSCLLVKAECSRKQCSVRSASESGGVFRQASSIDSLARASVRPGPRSPVLTLLPNTIGNTSGRRLFTIKRLREIVYFEIFIEQKWYTAKNSGFISVFFEIKETIHGP